MREEHLIYLSIVYQYKSPIKFGALNPTKVTSKSSFPGGYAHFQTKNSLVLASFNFYAFRINPEIFFWSDQNRVKTPPCIKL